MSTHYQNTALVNLSCSTVGSLKQEFQASIPHGYIVVSNPKGFQFNGKLPNPNSIYNNQLYTGVYIASNGAFSTSEDALQAWVNYNNINPQPSSPPPTDSIYNSSGAQLTAAEGKGITALGGGSQNYPIEADYTMATGDGALPQVVSLVPSMEKAYDAQNGINGNPVELTAVEELKGMVMTMFANKQTGAVPAPQGQSGLRIFDHQAVLPVAAGAPPLITDSGNITQLLKQCGDTSILPQVVQRLREIKPSASNSEITAVLQSNLVGMGETWYIYMDDSTGDLKMSQTAPSWIANLPAGYKDGTNADGNPINSASVFKTLGYSVDPAGEAEFKNVLFDKTSDPTSSGLATDEGVWTPSSGFDNLLGSLTFDEKLQGLKAATTPTPTPPPTCNCNPTTCQFPWDDATCKLGPNVSVNQVIHVLSTHGASPSFYHMAVNPTDDLLDQILHGAGVVQLLGGEGQNQSNMSWEAAADLYFNADRAYQGHSYTGYDLFENGHWWNLKEVEAWKNAPGYGQGFLKWFNRNNCGKTFVIIDQIN
jgi:hypothetical protein